MAHSFHSPDWGEMTNGGGNPVSSNGGQTRGSHGTRYYTVKNQHHQRRRSSSPMGRVILINTSVEGGNDCEDIYTFTVDKSPDGRMGFSVRGGSEHGLGIFVSKVEGDSPAVQAGLAMGDKLVEVNGVSLENITMSSAVKVLTGNNRLRMVVRRVGKIPGICYSKEKTTWVDLIHRRMVVEESRNMPMDASSQSALCRIVHLFITSDDCCLGFNIRGGKEFGLGIYVSKLDPDGLAEKHGIKMGDQILAANGVSFEDISHSDAVDVLRSHTHIMLTIREVGRYPAYKEMVTEYGWLDKLADWGPAASFHGSDCNSSASSLSSGTPLSSLSGLSGVLLPPVFSTGMVDNTISTEDHPRCQSRIDRTAETGIQTDPHPPNFLKPPSPNISYPDHVRVLPSGTSRTVGATLLLKDTVIRGQGERPREIGGSVEGGRGRTSMLSLGSQETGIRSPKTAALMALSKPRKAIRRSQSHITASEDRQKKKLQKEKSSSEGKTSLQRSKTFVNLLFKKDHKERSRSRSPSQHPNKGLKDSCLSLRLETLQHVEDMSKRLLSQDEVTAVMRHCQRFLSENVVEDLVHPLLAILDRPEKLLLLREIRMLIPAKALGHFDSMVMPFELEAYDVLKSCSVRSPALLSPRSGTPRRHLITPIPDYRGGFLLRPVQDTTREHYLLDKLERLDLSDQHLGHLSPSNTFRPLLDVPIDGFTSSATCSRSSSPDPSLIVSEALQSNQSGRQLHCSQSKGKNGTSRYNEISSLAVSDRGEVAPERGRSPVRSKCGRARREASPDSTNGRREGYTEVSVQVPMWHGSRNPLAGVFDPPTENNVWKGHKINAPLKNHDFKEPVTLLEENDINTVTISKAKQSLGISISGGIESRVQPVIKIEKIFPGGAASTNVTLKEGCELLSVDGENLQGVPHQHAVDVIRNAFGNKAKEPMVFVVRDLKVPISKCSPRRPTD